MVTIIKMAIHPPCIMNIADISFLNCQLSVQSDGGARATTLFYVLGHIVMKQEHCQDEF